MTKKVWGGRFQEDTDEMVDRFNASLRFDRRLYAQDILGSMAHCRVLAKQKVFSEQEASQILEALAAIKKELEEGNLQEDGSHEDIHTLVEKSLIERVGPLGEKIHTGRSRNDQVALDMRLYVREAAQRAVRLIKGLQGALVDLAERNLDLILPGYTHMQRAQPVLVSHHLLAYYEMLRRDLRRFSHALEGTDVLPLGSAALAGTTFALDRQMAAEELGFSEISQNSMDAVSDRDFILEYLFAASLLMMHLSRLSEELILWSTREFDFVNLPDAFCTGSSIMPQKKNPDVLELIRGKTGRVYGHLMGLLTVMKGLPMSYNKDMQEDKEPLFDTVDTIEECLEVLARLLGGVTFNRKRMRDAVAEGYLAATDLADYLVLKGETFRQAHESVGRMVLFAIEQGKELNQLTLEEMKRFSGRIDGDVYDWLDPESCVRKRNLPGGTGPEAVKESLERAKKELSIE
ncbi:MAG: argininosuccinate lyase [Deltaproteobacteria bacterium]|nr:argininosuccinate lyase [Deltaproteobacteria bacterium]MBW2129068.1 argininosuccinate lyase [Deltaproteobacteria bacterium]MBW2302675.1 argininosuccinate lyase [Deltaproteobacteria bacterium]